MLPDRVSNPGPLTYESGALPIALHGPAIAAYIPGQTNCSYSSNKSSVVQSIISLTKSLVEDLLPLLIH